MKKYLSLKIEKFDKEESAKIGLTWPEIFWKYVKISMFFALFEQHIKIFDQNLITSSPVFCEVLVLPYFGSPLLLWDKELVFKDTSYRKQNWFTA